jgi:putative hydrolase of HD superfamily
VVTERLRRQMDFIIEIDKLKTVLRRAYISDSSRRENSAEHSWHTAMMALVLADHTPAGVDLNRVLKMMLIHDIAEIDAGDVSIYHRDSDPGYAGREAEGAKRIFSLLPPDQARELLEIQVEFETGETAESKFARSLDRLIPLIHNYCTGGKRWREDGITYEQVFEVNKKVGDGSPDLWDYAVSIINECVSRGYLRPSK